MYTCRSDKAIPAERSLIGVVKSTHVEFAILLLLYGETFMREVRNCLATCIALEMKLSTAILVVVVMVLRLRSLIVILMLLRVSVCKFLRLWLSRF
jgi:hypothetical protein